MVKISVTDHCCPDESVAAKKDTLVHVFSLDFLSSIMKKQANSIKTIWFFNT